MPSLKLKVVKATNIKNTDVGSLTDPFLKITYEGKEVKTKCINNNLNPVWNEEFSLNISDPTSCVINFCLYDADTFSADDLIAVTSMPLSVLPQGEIKKMELQFVPHDAAGHLFIEATANDFTGLAGEVSRLNQVNNELKKTSEDLKNQVGALKGEVNKFSEENTRLENTRKALDTEVGKLKNEVGEFKSQNEKLKANVDEFAKQNAHLDETRKALDSEVGKLKGEVNQFKEQNEKLEATRKGLETEVGKLKDNVDAMKKENEKLEATRKGLESEVGKLKENVDTMKKENEKLEHTRKGLESEVGKLKDNVDTMSKENQKLADTEKALNKDVSELKNTVNNFDQKVRMLQGELANLNKTREALEESVAKSQEQNRIMSEELGKLNKVQEGLAQFAAKQGADYEQFVSSLTSSLDRHSQLIKEFSAENQKLKTNRKKIELDSMVALSNQFQTMDGKAGVSVDEFRDYLDTLGPDFTNRVLKGKTLAQLFAQLDKDKSGSLNIPELRAFLESSVQVDD